MHKINTVEVNIIPNRIEKIETEGDMYLITEAFKCTIKEKGKDKYIYVVKEGFKTNFRSGPDWLDPHITPIGELAIAISWLIHDVNYEGYLGSRKKSDKLLFQMLEAGNFDPIINEVVYIGLRLFGGKYYSTSSNNDFIKFIRPSIPILIDMEDISLKKEETLPQDVEVMVDDLMKDMDNEELIFDKTNHKAVEQELEHIAIKAGISISKEDIDKYYQ